MFTSGVVLIYDNARPHCAGVMERLLDMVQWGIFDHPVLTLSGDLALSGFYLFPELKKWLGGQSFRNSDDLQDTTNTHLKYLAAMFYEEGWKACPLL